MSLPDDWQVRINDLVNRGKDGRDSLYATLKELMEAGYVTRSQERRSDGSFARNDYIIHEFPQVGDNSSDDSTPDLDSVDPAKQPLVSAQSTVYGKPVSGNLSEKSHTPLPLTENPLTVKPMLLNINNTNNSNNQISIAATEVAKKPPTSNHTARSAVAIKKIESSEGLYRIGSHLTTEQQCRVQKVSIQLSAGVGIDPASLANAISDCLLDPKSFTQAKQDFLKKLNTIKKCIRERKFAFSSTTKVKRRELNEEEKQILRLRELKADRDRWLWLLEMAKTNGKSEACLEHFEKEVGHCNKAIKTIEQAEGKRISL